MSAVTATTVPPASHRAALVAAAQGRPGHPVVGGVRVLTGPPAPAPAQPSQAPAPAAAAPVAAVPVAAVPVVPGPAHWVEAIEKTLRAAEASNLQRTRTLAARARQLLTELEAQVAIEAEAREAEARVAQLSADLAAAKAELRGIRHPGAPATVTQDDVDQAAVHRAVRAWATTNGITVAPRGRVASTVVEQWRAATGGAV